MSLCLVACTKPDNNNDDANDTEEEIVEIETPNVRGKTDVVYTDNKDGTIYFGMYPQTKVTDQTLLTKLNEKIGTLPTANALGLWTAHDFVNANNYFEDYPDFSFFLDVKEDGAYYRAIYVTEYRLYNPLSSSTTSYQKSNGYEINTVYWFKYEPILWQVLTTKQDGSRLLFSDMAIDTIAFDNDGYCENYYATSTSRKFLTESFLNYAFTPAEIAMIPTVEVDNSAKSTGELSNSYATDNTFDKVFMPSVYELTEPSYGFNLYANQEDAKRSKKITDYGISQGAVTYTRENGKMPTSLCTRSPHTYARRFFFISPKGVCSSYDACALFGLAPMLYIKTNTD